MPDPIRQLINSGKQYLIIELVTGDVKLASRDDVFRRRGGPGPVQFVAVDLQQAYENFVAIPDVKDHIKSGFTLAQVAAVAGAGVRNHTVNYWITEGILQPSASGRAGRGVERKFDFVDAFTAGVIGSLSRHQIPLSLLRNVSARIRSESHTKTTLEQRSAVG